MIPFSLSRLMWTSSGRTVGRRVGIPMPRLTFIPLLTSFAALLAIFNLMGSLFLFFPALFLSKDTFFSLKSFSLMNFLTSVSPLIVSFSDLTSDQGLLGSS